MTKRNAIIVVAACGIALLLSMVAYQVGLNGGRRASADTELEAAAQRKDKSLDLICELRVSMPRSGIDSPRETYSQAFIARIDFTSKSGWYQGQFAISETRKGTVTTEGSTLTVRRPAMFQRFGATIAGETFSINRETGEFRQWLILQDGQILELMRGYCGTYAKAPF